MRRNGPEDDLEMFSREFRKLSRQRDKDARRLSELDDQIRSTARNLEQARYSLLFAEGDDHRKTAAVSEAYERGRLEGLYRQYIPLASSLKALRGRLDAIANLILQTEEQVRAQERFRAGAMSIVDEQAAVRAVENVIRRRSPRSHFTPEWVKRELRKSGWERVSSRQVSALVGQWVDGGLIETTTSGKYRRR